MDSHWWCPCSATAPAPSFEQAALDAADHLLWQVRAFGSEAEMPVVVYRTPHEAFFLQSQDEARRIRQVIHMNRRPDSEKKWAAARVGMLLQLEKAFAESPLYGGRSR